MSTSGEVAVPEENEPTYEGLTQLDEVEKLEQEELKQQGLETESSELIVGTSEEAWMRRLADHTVLTAAEEVHLAKQIERGDYEAKQKLIRHNIKLVISLAKKYNFGPDGGVSLGIFDLIDEGVVGLVRAAEKFDYRKGFKFSTYATWWIKQSIERALHNKNRTIRLPVNVEQESRKIDRLARNLTQENGGHEPTVEELAAASGVSEGQINHVRRFKFVDSLDRQLDDESEATVGETVELPQLSPLQLFIASEQRNILASALNKLPALEREAIVLHYGLHEEEFVSDDTSTTRMVLRKMQRSESLELALRGINSLRNILDNSSFQAQYGTIDRAASF